MLRALSICAPATLVCAPSALAETIEPVLLRTGIPALPLGQALAMFARQTGLQLVYVSSIVRDRRSRAIAVGLRADDALARLLQGTGLRFEYLTPRSVRILTGAGALRQAAASAPASDELDDVIVTATRREDSLQNVPITIQVLTGATLARLNATTFDDLTRYLPGVTAHGAGPAQNNIIIRGLATGDSGLQAAAANGTFPNVAVYLDEQSVQLPGRNLDIFAADLERIEVLEGPQGTLFGASAQAGVVRYITNKPKLDLTEAVANAGYATTAHGGLSSNLDLVVNVPLIADRLAVRGVIYTENRGGYIDNLPATFARSGSDIGIQNQFGGVVPANSVSVNNFDLATKDINPVAYQGVRVQALLQLNDDWSVLIAQSYQGIKAEGVSAVMAADSSGAPQPDLSAQLYNPSYDRDRFENSAVTVEGRAGALRLVYAGSYLVRNVDQVQDYTNYARGPLADYYQCVGVSPAADAQCFTPSSTWREEVRNTHQSHELRLSTPAELRVRAVGGLFYENYRIQDQTDWYYRSAFPYFNPIGPPTGYYTLNGSPFLPDGTVVQYFVPGAVLVPAPVTSNNPNVRPASDGYFDDITRGYRQRAVYASADVELVPRVLTLTAGTRYSRTDTTEVGSNVGSFGCQLLTHRDAPNPCVNHSDFRNIDAAGLARTYSGFRSRANLSWRVNEDALLYYTWSQGFRAGGFNRAAFLVQADSPLAVGPGAWQAQATKHGGWVPPGAFAPDSLTNNELGWKTLWFDRRIQWNGALYQEDWSQAQIGVYGVGVTYAFSILNGGSYRVRGIESSAAARLGAGLTIEAGVAWNQSELVRQATFNWADGVPIDFTTIRTSSNQPLPNPSGAIGSSLAGAPPFQGNLRVRYDFPLNGFDAFAQIGAMRQSRSLATAYHLSLDVQGNSTAYDLPAYTAYDAAIGVAKDPWLAQLYGENLTDTRAQLFADYSQWYKAVTVSRPRTLGLRFSYRFSGK